MVRNKIIYNPTDFSRTIINDEMCHICGLTVGELKRAGYSALIPIKYAYHKNESINHDLLQCEECGTIEDSLQHSSALIVHDNTPSNKEGGCYGFLYSKIAPATFHPLGFGPGFIGRSLLVNHNQGELPLFYPETVETIGLNSKIKGVYHASYKTVGDYYPSNWEHDPGKDYEVALVATRDSGQEQFIELVLSNNLFRTNHYYLFIYTFNKVHGWDVRVYDNSGPISATAIFLPRFDYLKHSVYPSLNP